jgi:hypothetical protein
MPSLSKEFPEFHWGIDARVEMRGPNVFIMLLDPSLIRRLAHDFSGARRSPVRRTNSADEIVYELMWVKYPYEVPPKLTGGEKHDPTFGGLLDPKGQSINRLFVDPKVAEGMIEMGDLVMPEPSETYVQYLRWAESVTT